ncbi:MAG: DUF1015 family protein [Acidobacteria bacterium]|nr:DUF1015 family protein [Acidobacteriota bacterium]MCA1607949.1 DUF1015 family protein [Acidobacteriota bacterium]
MSIIKAFRALRPTKEKARQVSCVPYDVALESEVRERIHLDPDSFLRVTRPEAEFSGENVSSEIVFERAKHHLGRMIESGTLVREPSPSLYVYRLAAGSHTQTGIVACCSIDEYESGLIKKHEKTQPDKVDDRTRHMLALRAQTGLIFLAFRDTNEVKKVLAAETDQTPIYDFDAAGGIRHTVWRVGGNERLIDIFARVPALYVADGHHRLESAARAREQLQKSNPNHTGGEDYNFVMAGIFPADELRILPYNRVVRDLNGTRETLLSRISENFDVEQSEKKVPEKHGEICLYSGRNWYTLQFVDPQTRELDPIERLDVSILQNFILKPILGIDDPRIDDRIAFVGGARGTDELERLVNEGSAAVAFSMFHTTMDDLFAVSDTGEIMPPKSTWFEPKLKDGLYVHLI